MQRQILLIGGNSGVGLEIAKLLADDSCHVHAAARSEGGLAGLGHVTWQPFDAVRKDAALELPERLDGFVYCPGTIRLKPFAQLSDDDFQSELEVNYLGAVRALRLALPALRQSEGASAVFFSTVAVQTGLPYHASIAGAKGAVEGLARALAAELAPKIRVNCLALSLTDTPLASKLLGSEEKRQASAERHPLKRVGAPAEVAKAAAFLLRPDAGFITGQVIRIDGGLSSLKLL